MSLARQEDDGPRGFVPRSELYKAQQKIDALQDELADVRDQLRDALGSRALDAALALPGMTLARAGMLCAMWSAPGFASYETLALGAKAGRRSEYADGPAETKTWVHWIRRSLAEAGCPTDPITNKWGVGYRMNDDAKRWFAERVEGGAK